MAIVGTLKTSAAGTSGSSVTTASITPTGGANAVVVVDIVASKTTAGINSPSVSGAGLVWTSIAEIEYLEGVAWQITSYAGLDTSGTATAGTLSISFSAQSQNVIGYAVTEYTGVDASSFANLVVQTATNSVSGSSSGLTVTLAAFADATNNAVGGLFSHRVDTESVTAEAGYTTNATVTHSTTPNYQAISVYKVGQDTTPSCTYTASVRGCLGLAYELKAASSGVTGTAAWTEGADTSAASGTFTTTGTAAWTEGADTAAASGWITVTGTAAWTEGADTIAASGVSAQFVGPAAWTEGADTAAGSGTFTTTGTAAWTEGADTASGAGTVINPITGTAAWTEGADTSAASGTFTTTGTSAWTEGADTAAGSGTYTPPAVTGTAAWTEGADTCSAAGVIPVIPPIGAVAISALRAASVAPTALRPYDVRVSAERPYLVKPTAERPYLVRVTAEHTGAVTVEAEGV